MRQSDFGFISENTIWYMRLCDDEDNNENECELGTLRGKQEQRRTVEIQRNMEEIKCLLNFHQVLTLTLKCRNEALLFILDG